MNKNEQSKSNQIKVSPKIITQRLTFYKTAKKTIFSEQAKADSNAAIIAAAVAAAKQQKQQQQNSAQTSQYAVPGATNSPNAQKPAASAVVPKESPKPAGAAAPASGTDVEVCFILIN